MAHRSLDQTRSVKWRCSRNRESGSCKNGTKYYIDKIEKLVLDRLKIQIDNPKLMGLAALIGGPGGVAKATGTAKPVGAKAASTVNNSVSAKLVVPVERIELPTFGLQNRCSTAELNRHIAKIRHGRN